MLRSSTSARYNYTVAVTRGWGPVLVPVLVPPDTKKEVFRLPFLGCPMGFEPMTFRTTI